MDHDGPDGFRVLGRPIPTAGFSPWTGCHGPQRASARRLNSAERLNPSTGIWEALPPMHERLVGCRNLLEPVGTCWECKRT